MVIAVQMAEHWHAGIFLYTRHKAFAAARDDEIDIAGKPFQHQAHGIAFWRLHHLDGGLWQPGLLQAFA